MRGDTVKVGLIEDQVMFRAFLKKICEDQFKMDVVFEADDGASGLAGCEEHRPELVLLDLNLPDLDGIEIAEKLALQSPVPRILALSSEVDEFTLYRVLNSGINGYVDKNGQTLEVLQEGIDAVMNGRCYFTAVVQQVRQTLRTDPLAFPKVLTDREQELLSLFGVGLSNEEIAEKVGLSPATVQGHRKSIMGKLDLHSTPHLIRYAMEKGFTKIRRQR